MGINKNEGILKFPAVLGKSQGLGGQTMEFLAKGEIISFDVGGANLAGLSIGAHLKDSS
jgi:hypothetical protein